jgi:Carboxypeptidase regulatory-like domain
VIRPAAYTLTGVITESVPTTSTMLSGVRVDLTDPANQGRFATTDSAGQYQITQVPAGTYTVRATLGGYVDLTKQVTVSANTSLDFALVPTPTNTWFKRFGEITPTTARCAGETRPCQVFVLPPVHNTGPFETTVLWTGADASFALQLFNADTGLVVASASTGTPGEQYLYTQIQAPGNYQLRVVALNISESVALTVHVTACPN